MCEAEVTIEELLALAAEQDPRPAAEIAESDVFGAWADEGITDSVEWVEKMRQKRRNRHQW